MGLPATVGLLEMGARAVAGGESQLRLSEVIGALSHALDLTEGQPPGHCMRACWIGFHVGQALGLSKEELWDLYYSLLLKDAGCSSNAERLCELYGHDDLETKRDFIVVDTDSRKQLASFVFAHAAPGSGFNRRLSRIAGLLRHGERLADDLIQTRCERGADIALQLGFSDTVSDAVRNLDEHWDGRGRPQRLKGDKIPLGSRIALLAQVAEVFFQIGGSAAAVAETRRRSGTWFDPAIVQAFAGIARAPEFWAPLSASDFAERLWGLEPGTFLSNVSEAKLDSIALAFAQIVDAKSHFTFGHCERVGHYADALARALGLAESHVAWVRRGALLHDLGKLGVSNTILNKPGALDANEWTQVKRHPALTEAILARIGPFRELARVAGAHHERLDGSGYPHGLSARSIKLETRIITVADIFDALTAARPYRRALPVEEALAIMEQESGSAIDPTCLEVLRDTLPRIGLS
jgi:HD-GYP domain-containing protein (c-di-GMP phosphodiesterase class II)